MCAEFIGRPKIESLEAGYLDREERRLERVRIRLTSEEARPIRYVLCEWSGEAGASSNMGAQLERLAQDPKRLEWDRKVQAREARKRAQTTKGPLRSRELLGILMGEEIPSEPDEHTSGIRLSLASIPKERDDRPAWIRAWEKDGQTIYVHSAQPTARDVDAPQERYCSKPKTEREKIRRAWLALRALAESRSQSLVILQALYGDIPPGLPVRGMFVKGLDEDYRRVVRYAIHGGTAREIEAAMRIDTARGKNETIESHKARVVEQQAAKRERVKALAAECEELIEDASTEYREAMKKVKL